MCIDIICKDAQKSGNDSSLWRLRCERISRKGEEREDYSYFDPFFAVFGYMYLHLHEVITFISKSKFFPTN